MDENPQIKADANVALYYLNKDQYNGVYDYIFKAEKSFLENMGIYYGLIAFVFVGIITSIFTPIGIVMILLAIVINSIFYEVHKIGLAAKFNAIFYIRKIFLCAYELFKIDFKDLDFHVRLKNSLKPFKKMMFFMNNTFVNEIEGFLHFFKVVFLIDFISYNRIVKILLKHSKEFHEIFKVVGEIDSVIAISEYRKILPYYCKPDFKDIQNIYFEDLYHPLVKDCVSNSIDIRKNIILTGSNASGKSTFIKSLAISMILAQNIYMCFSKGYTAKMSWVITSMAVRDNVLRDESYFIAEIKSLKRILDSLGDEVRVFCFIDEILKGTNTIERVAASSSILKNLSSKNCVVITASHDIELTEIMRNLYDNYHFKEEVTDEGVVFDYKLLNGHATTRNAIHLLKFMGYDEEIVDDANGFAEDYVDKRKWNVV